MIMKDYLSGKNIIVTGTSRGMGKAMVTLFAENGANVWALARKHSDQHVNMCESLSAKNCVNVVPVYIDLEDYDKIKGFIKDLHRDKTEIDGLVNNAGITNNSLFQMTSVDELRNQFEVNFFAPYYLTQLVSKIMIRNKGGSIVNISSTAAIDGNSGKSAYGASKAALLTMTKCISEELSIYGIRSNSICPGITDTDMIDTMPQYIIDMQKEDSFLKEIGLPKDIANTAMFLLSDYSKYITGQTIRVDGGITAYPKRVIEK